MSNVSGCFVGAARYLTQRLIGATLYLQRAGITAGLWRSIFVQTILRWLSFWQPPGQSVPFEIFSILTVVEISFVIVLEISFGKGAVLAFALIANNDMRCNALIDQPTKKFVVS